MTAKIKPGWGDSHLKSISSTPEVPKPLKVTSPSGPPWEIEELFESHPDCLILTSR